VKFTPPFVDLNIAGVYDGPPATKTVFASRMDTFGKEPAPVTPPTYDHCANETEDIKSRNKLIIPTAKKGKLIFFIRNYF
jgi:hypothetical protein